MTRLKDVEFGEFYFSPQDDIVRDFFIPALKNSDEYDRTTGFFTSSSLIELSVGVCDLATRHGKIRIITSPRLYPEDVLAIKHGYEMAKAVGDSMIRNFDRPEDPESLDRMALLSELISIGVLEIKVGIMKNLDQYPDAMFHPKFGIMCDSEGSSIAFTGSMNESRNGLGGNWDHIEVSSTDPIYSKRISILKNKFEKLWSNEDDSVMVIELPKIAQDLIDGYRSSKSMLDLDKRILDKYNIKSDSIYFKTPDWLKKNKRQYQEDAVEKWVSANYCGIYNMATGTGKTKTALRSLERLYNDKPNDGIFTVIVAPQKHLVDQWAEEVRNFSVNPIVGHSDHGSDWKKKFRQQMLLYRKNPINSCLVTTISSFTSGEVQQWISKIKNLALVVDEAHNMGSSNRLIKLPDNARYRLALSATMDRYKDESGTKGLHNYFGEECIHFTLEEAIGKYLSNYNYYPIICHYNRDEYNKLIDSNESLDAILKSDVSNKIKMTAKSEYLEYSYTLNAKMESKFDNLKQLMRNYVGKNHFLVYSGKVKTDEEGTFDIDSHCEFMSAIDKTSKILGKDGGLGMKISRITYKEDAKERQQIIKDFDSGDTEGIVAISCLDEGVDIPSIKTAVIMSSSDNPREYIQRRGRVLRICEGKEYADIYDFVVIPKAFDEVVPNSPHSGIELKMIAKEMRRMREFSNVALNPEETQKLFNKISSAYEVDIDEIIRIYGEELYGQSG